MIFTTFVFKFIYLIISLYDSMLSIGLVSQVAYKIPKNGATGTCKRYWPVSAGEALALAQHEAGHRGSREHVFA